MGKAKSRILHKGINEQIPKISRQEAIEKVISFLENHDVKSATNLITMFGLNAEEVLESGASYETVYALKNIFE